MEWAIFPPNIQMLFMVNSGDVVASAFPGRDYARSATLDSHGRWL
jgi:hypothetical protein